MVLDTSLLNTQQYKVRIEVKWSNPGKGVAPSLGVIAIEKGAFWSSLTTVANSSERVGKSQREISKTLERNYLKSPNKYGSRKPTGRPEKIITTIQ